MQSAADLLQSTDYGLLTTICRQPSTANPQSSTVYCQPPTACLLPLALLLALSLPAESAELRLRPQCQSRGSVVLLGDVAEIVGGDEGQVKLLAAIELFPTPPPSQQRFVRLREIQDSLLVHQVNLTEHRFSGSNQVTVLGETRDTAAPRASLLPAGTMERAKQQVREALRRYVQQRAGEASPSEFEFELNESHLRLLSDARGSLTVSGGSPPWTGLQHFELMANTPQGPARRMLDAELSVPSAVVVAVHPLSRGVEIREVDVQLQIPTAPEDATGGFRSIREVVGLEATRAIAAGRSVTQDAVRSRLLVRRGEVVAVYARRAGICVRTSARARDDGSLGDVITIEAMSDRQAFFARVSGPQETEVDPHTPAGVYAEDTNRSHVVRR